MREVFQRHLRPLDGKAYQVRECRVDYITRRQAKRCILRYTLNLEEPDTGRERSQGVTGMMYARGRARRMWEELRRSDPGRGIPGTSPAFAPFSYIPKLGMLVHVFPYDPQLPALPLLMAGPPPELEPLLLARFGPGDWRAEAWDVELVRYLFERRVTLRLTARARDAATGRAEERRFYMKVYNNEEKGERTYQVLRALWHRAGVGGTGFIVGRPIAYLSDLRTLIQEEVPGTSLWDVLLREDEATPAMCRAARALAALHIDRRVVTLRRHPLRDEVADLERKKKLLQQACPHLGPKIEEIVGAIAAGLKEGPLAPTHRDLKLQHILLDGDSLALLDLDEFAEADPIRDVAGVLAFLAYAPTWYPIPQDRAWAAARAFAEEYFAHVPGAWRTGLPPHYAGAVLRMAVGIYRSQGPGWPDEVEALVEEAKDSVEGRVW